jgi:hypothetical protein
MAKGKEDPKDPIGTGYEFKGPLVGSGGNQDENVLVTRTEPGERAIITEERSPKPKSEEKS